MENDISLPLLSVLFAAAMAFLLLSALNPKRWKFFSARLPPGPKGLPIIGNLHQLGGIPLHQSLWLLARTHGPIFSLQLGSIRAVVITSPALARQVLKTNDLDFCMRPKLTASNQYSYGGKDVAFAPYNEQWRELRKVCIVELFTISKVQSFSAIRDEEILLVAERIAHSSRDPVNLSEILPQLMNDIICRVALGKKYQERKGGGEGCRVHEIMAEAQACNMLRYVGDYFPACQWVDWLNGSAGRLQKNVREFDVFFEEVIEDHLCGDARKQQDQEDLIDALLAIQQEASYMTRDHIKGVLRNVFGAGTDTSAATTIWAMTELVRHPEKMKKAQDEVQRLGGTKQKIEESDMPRLEYLMCVIKETFRLHSAAPLLLPREAIRRTSIDEWEIPKGTRVYINVWGIGRDPETWQDPEEFIPERFLESNRDIDFKGQDFELIPFGSGRRICPALHYGSTLVALTLANLLYWFDWKLPEGMRPNDVSMEEAPGTTVHKKAPLKLIAVRSFGATT